MLKITIQTLARTVVMKAWCYWMTDMGKPEKFPLRRQVGMCGLIYAHTNSYAYLEILEQPWDHIT